MTMWERARSVRHCGLCGQPIEVGQPLLLIRFDAPAKVRDRVRCETCVGSHAPPDLPDLAGRETPPPEIDMTRLGALASRRPMLAGFTPELDDEG